MGEWRQQLVVPREESSKLRMRGRHRALEAAQPQNSSAGLPWLLGRQVR